MSNAEEEEEQIRVLHVDDEQDMGGVVAMHLERQRENMTVVSESSADDGLARLAEDDIDCVVSDHDMPGKNGLEFLRDVRESYPALPFILFTGKGSEEIASDAISAGVTEYLQKGTGTDQYAVLANRIERSVSAKRAKHALEESERRLSTLISNLPGMVYRCRNERGWPMTFVSDGARDLTGYSPAAIESGEVSWGEDVLLEADRREIWDRVQTAVNADEPFEVTYRIETADGEERWMWERGRVVDCVDRSDVIEGFVTDITARKEHERELQAEREFTENVVNSLEDVFFVIGEDGSLVRWNDRVNEVTGYTDAQIRAMDAIDFFTEDHGNDVLDAIGRALDGERVRFEKNIETKAGEEIPFEFRGTALFDANGDVLGVSGVGRDVSERKARERELEQYRTLVESVSDPMYVLGPDGTIEMVNHAMADLLDCAREDIVGRTANEFMPETDVGKGREMIQKLLDDEDRTWATFEMRSIAADGTMAHNEDKIAVLTDDDGNFQGSVGVIRDISDRKERERELERYESIIQVVGDPVYTLDDDGVFTFVNEAMESLSGYDRQTLVGKHISTVMTGEDVAIGTEIISELLQEEDITYETMEMDVVTESGEHVPCENHIALLPLEDGEFRGTAGVVRDITERKERERRLEEFASVVSHDLRNPLNVVQGRVQLALESGEVENLDAALDAAERMERLIDDLLRLARQGRDVDGVEPVAIADVAADAWDHLVSDGASLTVDTTRTVEADPERLCELFENLFRNAIQHGARGDGDGPITVRLGDTGEGFFVEDDGVGIEPDRRDAVFDRGYTTSTDGTGFGLAIVDSIASAHDWTISVADAADAEGRGNGSSAGARFEVVF